jgi:hypothetical protein
MSKPSSTDALSKIIEQLQYLGEEERTRVIRAVRTFFDNGAANAEDDKTRHESDSLLGKSERQEKKGQNASAKAYFDKKRPRSKLEELAVAARFREETASADSSTQEELKTVFLAARRTFDAHNFRRDLDNARTKGLFMRGTGRNLVQLSSYGQSLADALPDRQELKNLVPPKGSKKARKKVHN